jgi:hypothetical protein
MAGPASVSARYDAERIVRRGRSRGRRWLRLFSLQRFVGRVACLCVAFASLRHAVPLRHLRSSPRDLVWPGKIVVDWRALPLRFSDAKAVSRGRLARRSPFAGDVDFVLDRSGEFAVEHVRRLARDTHLAVLFERDERTAGAHPAVGPCVRDTLRTVAQLRVMHLGRLFARRSATRIVNGRRATWPTDGFVSARHSVRRICARAFDRRRSWDSSCPSQV